VIPVEDQVDFGLKAYLERAVKEALAQKPDVILFKVNTYGGELQSAFDIVDLMMGITECSTYAYVEQKAISAGALISLANNRIAMGEGTTIGDCAPITQGQEGIVMLGEKIQSPLRAKFRTLAERNGYPTLPLEAMVTADIGVVGAMPADSLAAVRADSLTGTPYTFFTAKQWEGMDDERKSERFKSHKVVAAEGQLLTLTDREAEEYGISQGSYESIEAFIESKGWTRIGDSATTWSEDLVRLIGTFAPLLMLIGFGALYLEFKTPGLSIFGLLGLICLGIVFGSKYAVGLANHTELLLLLAGVALFLLEIYVIPGTFIAGGLGLVLMVIALALSLQEYTLPDPEFPWQARQLVESLSLVVGMAALALFIPLIAIRYVLPNLHGRASVVAHATLADSRATAAETLVLAVGQAGTTKTALRPTGKAVFGEHTYEVSSRGEYIDAGKPVEVARIEGNKIVVRPREAA
jgi:membrane-bound serine protease (ClpP class)